MELEEIYKLVSQQQYVAAHENAVGHLAEHGGIDCLHLAGLSKVGLRMVDDGMLLLKAAASFRPSSPHIYINAGAVAEQLCRADDLEFFTSLGLRDFPDDKSLRRQRANVFLLRQDYSAAIAHYQLILADDLDDARTWVNLGNAHRLLNNFEDATFCFRRAMEADPENAPARINYASMCIERGCPDDAVVALGDIQDHDADYIRSLILLGNGDYQQGWSLHRGRWNSLPFRDATVPECPFESLEEARGKRIVVLREGGHGDLFMFWRYMPMLAQIASEILFHPLPSEQRLLTANVPDGVVLRVASDGRQVDIPGGYSHSVALMDLPFYFGTTLDTIPSAIPYLHAPENPARRLPPCDKMRVGLCWSGARTTGLNQRTFDAQRSIPLDQLEWLAAFQSRVEFINLTFDERDRQGRELQLRPVLDATSDWLDTANIVAQCDLVISVDTAVAHLAAAMGRPTWVLSRFAACWRWLHNRTDSPWYPHTLRVFGQSQFNDWSAAFAELRQALDAWLLSVGA